MSTRLPTDLELPVPPSISWKSCLWAFAHTAPSARHASFSLTLPFKLLLIQQSPNSNDQSSKRPSLALNSKLLCSSQFLAYSQAQVPGTLD